MLVAVDPGINGCGVAVFERQLLTRAFYCKNDCPKAQKDHYYRAAAMAAAVWDITVALKPCPQSLIVEYPRVYRAGKGKGNPSDLLLLTAVGGALAVLAYRQGVPHIQTVEPEQWKGQLPKEISHARILATLTSQEKCNIVACAQSYMHNVLDAIGIGLWRVSR